MGSGHDVLYYDNFITSQLAVIRLQDGRREMEGKIEVETRGGRESDDQRIKTDDWTKRLRYKT